MRPRAVHTRLHTQDREAFSDDRRDELLEGSTGVDNQDPQTYPLCMRLLCVWLLAHVQTIAAAAPVVTVASNSAPAVVSPAKWHLSRRSQILSNHPEVKELIGKEEWTVPILAATNIAQVGCATAFAHLPAPVQLPLAILLGGTLSLWQFTLLHDVIHGTAALPKGVRRNDVLFAGSLPSLFGYYLYLRYGHLTHHKSFGGEPLAALFDSEQSDFEDGDALFVAHRQRLSGDQPDGRIGFFGKADVGGLGISISRTIYALLWLDAAAPLAAAAPAAASMPVAADSDAAAASAITDAHSVGARARAVYNAAVFAFSMTFERAALVVGGSVVPALVGRNFFFPTKPDDFHSTCANYARVNLALALGLYVLVGPGAIAWLFWSEVGWQLPVHPASAMFVSNHPSLTARAGAGAGVAATPLVGGCQPTASVYLGPWYDWLCCFSNFHTEHHGAAAPQAFPLEPSRSL
jgi:fatty acid desaturase